MAAINQGPYAIIVSDMAMPDMNGIEFLGQARILALTAMRNDVDWGRRT